ncbi:MAG: hypothetical protein FWC43_13945 [Planctomycetaceae bacterium]|nr:hypothetical protein [Planctomycetaceae bacterium]
MPYAPCPLAAEPFDVQSVFDLTESEWNEFVSIPEPIHFPREPLHFPREPLLRLLNRMGQRHVESLLRDQSVDDPNRVASLKQGEAVHFSQNVEVESVQRIDFTPFRNLPEFDHFYISRVKIANQFDAVCVSLQVPRFDPPERSGFLGILLAPGKTPVFAASRLEWFPQTLLGNYGMDVALLDAVAPIPPTGITRENRHNFKLTEADQEPFYRLLTTVTKIPGQEIDRNIPPEKFSVVELFNRPQFQQGRLIRLVGYARRIERVNIDDPEITARFGIDHYYQIALFTEDSQGNPLFFCIPKIPAGLPLGEEEGFPVPLSISGFFYKTWAYRKMGSGNPAEEEKKSLTQLAPLLVGAKIDWFRPQEKPSGPSHSLAPLYSSSLAFFVLVFLWFLLRRFRNRSQSVRFQLKSVSEDEKNNR